MFEGNIKKPVQKAMIGRNNKLKIKVIQFNNKIAS